MGAEENASLTAGAGGLIRVGGAAALLALALHIVLNGFIKAFPPPDLTAAELARYLSTEAGSWAVVHGLRYVAFFGVVLFTAALFVRTGTQRGRAAHGWALVGLLGGAIWTTNGVVTNGIEALAFGNGELVAGNQELFRLLFELTRVLFTAEIAAWAIFIFGFSVAGRCGRTLPAPLVWLGVASAALGMSSAVLLAEVVRDGWAVAVADLGALSGLTWIAWAAGDLLWRGEGPGEPEPAGRAHG